MSPANHCYCNSKKRKAPLLCMKPRKAGCQGPSFPKHPQLFWVSDWWITHCSDVQVSVRAYAFGFGVLRSSRSCFALHHFISLLCHSEILKFSPAFYMPATAQQPDLTVNCHLYHLQPPSDKSSFPYRVSLLFIQFLDMVLSITHFGQAVLKYTPTVM